MRQAYLFAILIVMLVLASPAVGEAPRHDGHLWAVLSRELKVSYMQGLIDGSAVGVAFVREGLPQNDDCDSKVLKGFEKTSQRYFAEVSPAQLVDGVDALFKDYRNQSLLITDAVYVALRAIGGMSPDDVEKLLQAVRRAPR